MKAGGWFVDGAPDHDIQLLRRYNHPTSNHCYNHPTFWGYMKGQSVGYVQATFKGSGKARLNFGNCVTRGVVKAYLNDREISSAGPTESRKVSFNYEKGDILKITHESYGIIKIYYLKLMECDGMNMLV